MIEHSLQIVLRLHQPREQWSIPLKQVGM
jgi:hypothetical protein